MSVDVSGLRGESALADLRRAAEFLGLPSGRALYAHVIVRRNLPLVPLKIGREWYLRWCHLEAFVASPMPCAEKRRNRSVARASAPRGD